MDIVREKISDGGYDKAFVRLYGKDVDITATRQRFLDCLTGFEKAYGDKEYTGIQLFSVSGRSEFSGNHTDHNRGKVLCASINLDVIAVAAKNDKGIISVTSEGFGTDEVDIKTVSDVVEKEKFTSSAIIRGVCDGFEKNGRNTGGYYAYTTSNVLKGSGLSSSAAFENMIGNILNHLYNDGKVDNIQLAKISQYAENVHFMKPCGLMDQLGCAVGGVIAIDFEDVKNPVVRKIDFDLDEHNLSLCIVNTGGNHADLNEDYASVPCEMKKTASLLGVEFLRQTSKEKLISSAVKIRSTLGDRALMRAMHFFDENVRVDEQVKALSDKNIKVFLEKVRESGISSFTMLQNVYTSKNVHEQGLSLALALCSHVLGNDKNSAYRVHGGGFAGTIQAFVPKDMVETLKETFEKVFGTGCVYVLNVRKYGAVCLDKIGE